VLKKFAKGPGIGWNISRNVMHICWRYWHNWNNSVSYDWGIHQFRKKSS